MAEAFRAVVVEGAEHYVSRPLLQLQQDHSALIVVADPLLLEGAPAGVLSGVVSLRPVLREIQQHGSASYTVYLLDHEGNFKTGWPQKISAKEVDRVLAGDITGDGIAEVIVYYSEPSRSGENTFITVFDRSGHELSGWPQWAAVSMWGKEAQHR